MLEIENELKKSQGKSIEKIDSVPLKKESIIIPDKSTITLPQKLSEASKAEILVLSVTGLPFASPATQKYQVLVETSQLLQLNKKYILVL